MTSPWASVPFDKQAWLFCILLVLTIGWMLRMQAQAAPLRDALPGGVVGFEVPWSPAQAQANLQRLGEAGIARLIENTRLDLVFLLLYPVTLSLLCSLVSARGSDDVHVYGAIFCWAALAAMPLDALENVAMLLMLGGRTSTPIPQACTIVSTLKWGVFLGSAAYAVLGAIRIAATALPGRG